MTSSRWTWSTAILYSWHLIDGLSHLLLESTYVYGCFRHSIPIDIQTQSSCAPSLGPCNTHDFLGRSDRLYGNIYGNGFFAKIWHEYAKADNRYAGIDLTTLSLEIVTVFLAGPLALYVAEQIRRDISKRGYLTGRTWFWVNVLAVAELYGGLLNFLPEWLTGNSNLQTDNPVYFWVYIVFFNAVWIAFPIWILRQAYVKFVDAFQIEDLYKTNKKE